MSPNSSVGVASLVAIFYSSSSALAFKEEYGAEAWEERLEMQRGRIDLPRQKK